MPVFVDGQEVPSYVASDGSVVVMAESKNYQAIKTVIEYLKSEEAAQRSQATRVVAHLSRP